jgi:hypothetical protein
MDSPFNGNFIHLPPAVGPTARYSLTQFLLSCPVCSGMAKNRYWEISLQVVGKCGEDAAKITQKWLT